MMMLTLLTNIGWSIVAVFTVWFLVYELSGWALRHLANRRLRTCPKCKRAFRNRRARGQHMAWHAKQDLKARKGMEALDAWNARGAKECAQAILKQGVAAGYGPPAATPVPVVLVVEAADGSDTRSQPSTVGASARGGTPVGETLTGTETAGIPGAAQEGEPD